MSSSDHGAGRRMEMAMGWDWAFYFRSACIALVCIFILYVS